MEKVLSDWIKQTGISEAVAGHIVILGLLLGLLIVSYLADVIAKRVMLSGLGLAIKKSRSKWDDILYEKKVFNRIAHLVPALVIYVAAPHLFTENPLLVSFLQHAAFIYMVLITVLALNSFLDGVHDIYSTTVLAKQFHGRGLIQATKLVLFFIGFILILSTITSKSPLYFLSGLGALTAVLILVFKDAILGFVAGIQLSANNMVAVGDWIEMPQFGADGDVIDITLTAVKVRNWDKTITTIPTYALISQSFKNWRGMQEIGGRRIKRAINIDITSIRFCDEEMIERFRKIRYISEYMDRKKEEIKRWNVEQHVDDAALVNKRRLTNVGTFRAYVSEYLRHHPKIRQDLTFLVRQLAPADNGLPIEIYVFTNDIVWANYEAIQADIFDHLLAAVPEFDLRVYQQPSGADFQNLAK